MLAINAALLAGIAPLMNGAWDLGSRALLVGSVLFVSILWALFHIASGRFPLPQSRLRTWGILVALGGFAAWMASPVRETVRPSLWVWLAGVYLLLSAPLVTASSKRWIDRLVHAAAWVQLLLLVHQGLFSRGDFVGTLVKENALAGYLLLLLPFAVQRGDYVLAAGLSVALWKTGSVAAFLAILLVAGLYFWIRGHRRIPLVLLGGAVLLLAWKANEPEVLNRLAWWKAALAMALERPGLGFGPGAFTYVLGAFFDIGEATVATFYPHNAVLGWAAETGWAVAGLWILGVAILMRGPRGQFGARQAGVLLLLIQSLFDFGLSIPGLFWLWCYFLSEGAPEEPQWFSLQGRAKAMCGLFLFAIGAVGLRSVRRAREAQTLFAEANVRFSSEGGKSLESFSAHLEERFPNRSQSHRFRAAQQARQALEEGSRFRLLAAAASQERALEINPYRRASWTELAGLYRTLGRHDLARATLEAKRDFFFARGSK